MAASAWKLFYRAKKKIGAGTLVLTSTASSYKMQLCTSAAISVLSTSTALAARSLLASCTPIVTGGGYANKSVTGNTWTIGSSANKMRFKSSNIVFTAVGSSITNVKYAVIGYSVGASSAHALCYSKLTTGSQFNVTSPNTLTIVIDANGYFEMA